jgi:hypothetical protein
MIQTELTTSFGLARLFATHPIISRKHGGQSDSDNLAYACLRSNAWKGSNVGSVGPETGAFASLFNPRRRCCRRLAGSGLHEEQARVPS